VKTQPKKRKQAVWVVEQKGFFDGAWVPEPRLGFRHTRRLAEMMVRIQHARGLFRVRKYVREDR
jgi:hypothetical protein